MRNALHRATHPAVASGLVALTLTALLYGDALTLPLFSDDLVQIPWLESISWGELWSTPSPYGYHRPLWYSLWRVWGALCGGLHPPALHLLNVAAHFGASWLAGLLASSWILPHRLSEDEGAGSERVIPALFGTALFATFPFARQAVAWPGAVYNPLVSAMAAGALLAYDRGRRVQRTRWISLSLLLALLSAFTYEAGLLVAVLVTIAEVVGRVQHRWERSRSWWPLAFVVAFAAATSIWQAMRGGGATGFGLNPDDLRRNIASLTAGLIYPTAVLAQAVAAWSGLQPELSLWLVALPTVALLAAGGLRHYSATFLLGTGWFLLFSLPPLVSMRADWFALAPRFLYMTDAGASLVWASALSAWLRRLRPRGRAAACAVLLVALLAPAAAFVRDGMRLYGMAGEAIWDAVDAAQQHQPVLLVNLPKRITPTRRTYPLGFEGITPLPDRASGDGLIYVHTGVHSGGTAVQFGIVAVDDPPGYGYELFGDPIGWKELADAAGRAPGVYLARYEPGRIHLLEAGGSTPGDGPDAPLARFRDRITLLGATCTCDEAGQVRVTATWRVDPSPETDVTVFAHLLNQEGSLVAQADGYPLLGLLPFWQWRVGRALRDVRYFDGVPSGEYTVRLGLWELATGEHWPADGHPEGVVELRARCP